MSAGLHSRWVGMGETPGAGLAGGKSLASQVVGARPMRSSSVVRGTDSGRRSFSAPVPLPCMRAGWDGASASPGLRACLFNSVQQP